MARRENVHGKINKVQYPFEPKSRHPEYTEIAGRWDITTNLEPDLCPCRVCNHPFMETCSPPSGVPCDCCSEQCT